MLKNWSVLSLVIAFLIPVSSQDVRAQEDFGSFQGDLIVKTLPDGRNLELTHPFTFIDPAGRLWAVPVGTVVNGASIPQAFWSIIGGPFEDKYREASVIHDHHCDQKTDTWENVHLVFYNGMRAKGVGSVKAKLMYAAVYNFGPRWVEVNPGDASKLISGTPVLLNDAKEAIVKFIAENDPSIADIQEISARLAEAKSIDQLERILFENANCTPILPNVGPDVVVGRTLVLCGLSVASKKQAAIKNLRTLVAHLRELLRTQRFFLLPMIDEYVDAPDPAKWGRVVEWSRNVHGLIKLGIRSVLDVEDARAQAMAPPIDDVFEILSQRAAMISPILSGPPKSRSEMQEWIPKYRILVGRLEQKLSELEQHLSSISQ